MKDEAAVAAQSVGGTAAARFSFFPAIPPPVDVRLVTTEARPCPYLPGRTEQTRAFWARRMPGALYHQFMDAGFRRSGKVFYQPVCNGCRACMPIRVPVATFRPGKSQRRCWRRNADLVVTRGDPRPTDEKYSLYRKYLAEWHKRDLGDASDGSDGYAGFVSFLYESPVDSIEYVYRDVGGRLLAVGICDVCAESLSSVYFYHDPRESARGLGTFGVLREIEDARALKVPFYYLGYWIDGCRSMQYKSGYGPNELLHPDGAWRARGEDKG